MSFISSSETFPDPRTPPLLRAVTPSHLLQVLPRPQQTSRLFSHHDGDVPCEEGGGEMRASLIQTGYEDGGSPGSPYHLSLHHTSMADCFAGNWIWTFTKKRQKLTRYIHVLTVSGSSWQCQIHIGGWWKEGPNKFSNSKCSSSFYRGIQRRLWKWQHYQNLGV